MLRAMVEPQDPYRPPLPTGTQPMAPGAAGGYTNTMGMPPRPPAAPPALGGIRGAMQNVKAQVNRLRPVRPPVPAPPVPPAPQTGGPDMPGNLRGDVYTPGTDPRLTNAQGATDTAGAAVQNGTSFSAMAGQGADRYRSLLGTGQVNGAAVNQDTPFNAVDTDVAPRSVNTQVAGGPAINTNFGTGQVQGGPSVNAVESARTQNYGSAQDQALAGLGGPNRTELARTAAADLRSQGATDLQNRFRKVGQSAAKFGRIGMGDVNAELGSIQGDFERDLMGKENELARSVAEGDISDRFRRVDATAGLRGQEAGIDTGLRGESRQEREYGTGLGERNVGREFDRAGARDSAARAERDYGTGLGERNVARDMDDRDFTTGVSERNLSRRSGERDAGLGAAERQIGRRTGERDTQMGLDERNQDRSFDRARSAIDYGGRDATADISDRYDRFGAAGSLEDRIYGQGQGNRDEMRNERGYQNDMQQRTLENRLRQRGMENEEQDAAFRRNLARQQVGAR